MPDQRKSHLGRLLASLGVVASVVFILNFTVGIFEIPDNIPVVGNLDEAFFTWLLIASLRYLGFDSIPFGGSGKEPARVQEG